MFASYLIGLFLFQELEEMKLCNPKFGLHTTMFTHTLGDAGDSFSVLTASEKKRINELENEVCVFRIE